MEVSAVPVRCFVEKIYHMRILVLREESSVRNMLP